MMLLVVYLVASAAGSFATYLIVGQVVERILPAASLPAFLALFFLSLWVAWLIAVKVTAPSGETQAST
jgi:hypothetical protein